MEKAKLKVNDKQVPLNDFVSETIHNVIIGLVKSLKLDEQPRKIEVEINID